MNRGTERMAAPCEAGSHALPVPGCRKWLNHIAYGCLIYYFTSLIVIVAVMFSSQFVKVCKEHPDALTMDRSSFVDRFAAWDGVWYRGIARDGYSYNPERMSNVAFYPLYPLAGRIFSAVFRVRLNASLLIVSHLFLLGAFVVFSKYLAGRPERVFLNNWRMCLVVFGLFPTTFYFRMSYSESIFLFFVLLAMYGMQQQWPFWLVAVLAGTTTAARPVGLAVALPFLLTVWKNSSSPRNALINACAFTPICVWGLLAYMAYQQLAIGDYLASVRTQAHWQTRIPPEGITGKIASLVTFEPIWSVYLPGCQCYWGGVPPKKIPEFNLHFFNPIIVLSTWLLAAVGSLRKWLSSRESLLCAGLLAIPYITHSYHACMASEGRYASVVFPVYIVIGILVERLPREGQAIAFASMAVMLSIGSMMFTAWYWYF